MNAEKPNGAERSSAPAPGLPQELPGTIRRTRGSSPARRGAASNDPGAAPKHRSTAPNRSKAAKKANGHANGSANHAAAADGAMRAASRMNGHGHASSSVPAEAIASPLLPDAGADDASGASVAIAPATAGAGADRQAYAAPAESTDGKKRHSSASRVSGFVLANPEPTRVSGFVLTNPEPTRVSGFVLTNPEPTKEKPRVPSESAGSQGLHLPAQAGLQTLNEKSESKPVPPGEGPLPEDPADFVEEIHHRVDLFEIWKGLLGSTDDKIRQRAVEKLTDLRYKSAQSLAEDPQPIVIDIDSAVARRAAEGARK